VVESLVLGRRSVREGFTDRAVEERVLRRIVRAGLAAPSSKDAQPWRVHVVPDRAVLAELADAVAASPEAEDYVPHDPRTGAPSGPWPSTVAESADVLRHVAAALFVENRGPFGGGRAPLVGVDPDELDGALVGYTFEVLGVGAAVQSMWLMANALGVHAAFMGDVAVAEAEIQQRLSFEGDLLGVLALGYSDDPRPPRTSVADQDDAERVVWHRRR
jgi:nitroreductase